MQVMNTVTIDISHFTEGGEGGWFSIGAGVTDTRGAKVEKYYDGLPKGESGEREDFEDALNYVLNRVKAKLVDIYRSDAHVAPKPDYDFIV